MRGRAAKLAAATLVAAQLAIPAEAAPASNLRAPNLKPADLSSAEAGLWGWADRAEAYLKTSADLDRDPALADYVRRVVCRVAREYCPELRVYVLDRPPMNATAAPNGYLEVNSGLLLRARTEDELAYVLGHEVSHFGRNHSLNSWRRQKTTANVMLALQVGVTLGAAAAMYSAASTSAPNASQTIDSISQTAQSLNNLIYLQGIASIFAYGREQETEADLLGQGRASAAGYDPTAGISIWSAVTAETQNSDFAKVRKSEARASMFDTHPLTADRIAALKKHVGRAPGALDLDAARRYRAAVRPHLAGWLKDDLRRRDYGQSLYVIERLETVGEDAGLLAFYRGEAYRLRRGDGDAVRARAAYELAITHPDAPPTAWRELAELRRKGGDKTGARAAFERYLLAAPAAEDRWLVEASLKSLLPEAP